MDYLLCITRSTTGLEAKASRCQSEFRPPESDQPNWQNLYETASVPFKDIKPSPTTQQLCAAWQRLKAVDKWDASTLTEVLVVLTESVAIYDTSSLSFPILRAEPAPPKPTAVHPRAFRGTKYKPPKLKRPAPVNLQIALCNMQNQAIVLQALWQHREKAIKPLCDLGYDSLLIESLLALSAPPTEPNLFLRYPDVPNHAKSQLFPRTFREEILPLLREISWHRVEATLDLFWHFELHEQIELRTTVSRFLAQSPTPSALDWLQHIANQPSEHHITLLIFAVELNVARSPCPIGVGEVLNALHEFASLERYPRWAYTLLAALRDGISAHYLRDGVHLAGEFDPRYRFDSPKPCDDFSRDVVEEVLYRLLGDELSEAKAMTIWKAAAKLAGFCDVLAAVEWASLTSKQVSAYLQLLLNFSYYYEDDEAANWQKKWRVFKKHQVPIEKCLLSVCESYVEQWVNDFNRFIKPDIDNAVLADIMKDAAILAKRLAQPPYRSNSDRGLAFGEFIRLHDAVLRQRVLETPDVSVKRLDEACRRENDAKLIAWGLKSILEKHATIAVDCLWHSPKKLAKTTKLLGSMSWELCRDIMREFAHHSIITTDFDSLSLPEVYETLQAATRRCNPIPKTLRDYFEGTRTLSEAQLERHRKTILDRLLETKLQVLEEIAEQVLWRGFETASNLPDAKHALQLLRDLFSRQYSNKRAFRRFLKEYFVGNTDYLYRHPLTLKFAQRHSKINLDIWTRGIILESYDEKQYVSITLEQKPLEVLKLGTYVGSCLGIGGLCTDSAVAVVLDVNKQVLYARDENGVVLARQLVAISKDEQVVAFEVYPLNTSS
ncbi:MAG TPA: hypothetical protein ENI48_02180, partial [Thioploca sp.]|nr:hypothetical protein [Thioploca sp.]